MEFLTPGEKIKSIRTMLGLKQHELASTNITRNFISMLESGKRNLTVETAEILADTFNKFASEKGIAINVTAEYLVATVEEDIHKYYLRRAREANDLKTLQEIIDYASSKKLHDILVIAYESIGNIHYNNTDYIQAHLSYNYSLEEARYIGNEERFAFLFNKLGKCKVNLLAYIEAITYFNRGYSYASIYNDLETKKNILFNLAFCNKRMKNYNEAIALINEYLPMCNSAESRNDYLSGVLLKANCYIENKEYSTALMQYYELLNMIREDDSEMLGTIYNNIALIYFFLDELDKSLIYFDKAEVEKRGNEAALVHTMVDKSRVFVKQNRYLEARDLIKQGVKIAKSFNDKLYLIRAYSLLEEIYISLDEIEELESTYLQWLEIEEARNSIEGVLKLCGKLAQLQIKKENISGCNEYLNKLIKFNKSN